MCGLVGVAGSINKEEKDAFKFLLHLDIFRGPHSTGVASVKYNGDWELVKKKGTAWDLYDSKEFTSLMTSPSYCLIGHNRYATKGKVNSINAHPFEFADVVGAHNGTIRGQHRLPDHTQFEVDSENIFYAIQNEGLDETLGKLDGAYALTYWDKRTEELILVRNQERSLYYCYSEDKKTVFWASEAWMLSVSLSRHRIKYTKIEEVPAGQILRFNFEHKFKPEDITCSFQKFEVFQPPKKAGGLHGGTKATGGSYLPAPKDGNKGPLPGILHKYADFTVDGAEVNAYGQHYISGSLLCNPSYEVRIYFQYQSPEWNNLLALKADSIFKGKILAYRMDEEFFTVQLNTIEEAEDEEEEEEYSDTFLGFNNKLLTQEQFEQKTKRGCAWCTSPVTVMDAKYIHWVDDNDFICQDCCEVDEVKEYIRGA